MAKHDDFVLTPLGAAIVEALPDRKLVSKIKSDFRRRSVCPVSVIFDETDVEKFYRERGQQVKAVIING